MNHELYFVIRHEQALERIFRVEVAETTIGRSPTNELCLPDPWVSRNHAVLLRTPKGFLIRDLRSQNGTQLNGQSIVEVIMPVAALVQIGPYSLKACGDLGSSLREANAADESTFKRSLPVVSRSKAESYEQKLTSAQRRVYDEFLQGRTEKEVAALLDISINTVHTHSRAIYAKFAVSSRPELLARSAANTQHVDRDEEEGDNPGKTTHNIRPH